jgi:ABC-type bacteriocin/lantibiotic exporter with double-glycine peptidase domain
MELWVRFLAFYRPAMKTIFITVSVSALQAGLSLPIAWLLRNLFDGRTLATPELIANLLAIALTYITSDALLLFSVKRNLAIVKPIARQIRMEIIEGAIQQQLVEPSQSMGMMHSALVQDVESADQMAAALLCRVLPAILSTSVLFAVMAWLSSTLFCVMLLILLIGWQITALYRKKLISRVGAFDASSDAYNRGVITLFQRVELTRTHGAERAELERHGALAARLETDSWSVSVAGNAMLALHNQVAIFSAIGVLFIGNRFVAEKSISIGDLLAFYIVLGMARTHLTSGVAAIPSLMSGHVALRRLLPLLTKKKESAYVGREIIDFDGGVEVRNVSYGYGDERVLQDVSLNIAPGRVTALTGSNGSGKTTIARLVLGLDRPSEGELCAGGKTYVELSIEALRRKVAFVAQDPVIFAGSVRDNLIFGLDHIPGDADLTKSLTLVGADFVHELQDGLASWLGDSGVVLSGGQRQRLSIARAALRSPALLILDEPTNHLGSAEARAILFRLIENNPKLTVLLISHDPELLALAQTSWHLAAGKVTNSR